MKKSEYFANILNGCSLIAPSHLRWVDDRFSSGHCDFERRVIIDSPPWRYLVLGEERERGLIPIYVCIALEQLYSPLMFMYNSWNVNADAIFLMHFYGT